MLMIVAFHFVFHTSLKVEGLKTVNNFWCHFLSMGGGLGDSLFFSISGYFLVMSHRIKIAKLFNLWIRMFFYSVVVYFLFVLSGTVKFDIMSLLKAMCPITQKIWWFARTYFIFYVIHPYVNIFLRAFNRESYKKFLAVIFLCFSVIPILIMSPFTFKGSGVVIFFCLYSLTGYIRLWADNFGGKKYILYGIFFIAANFTGMMLFEMVFFYLLFLSLFLSYFP